MLARVLVPTFALVLCVGSVGCAGATDEETSASEDELRALTIKDSDNGKTFTVEKGGSIKVSLSANATTGYAWKVVSTSRSLGYPAPLEGVYEGGNGGPTGPIGGGGAQIFTWKLNSPVLQPSTTAHAVKLEYRRSFESDDVPAAKTFKFKVKVKEGAAPPPPPPAEPIVLFEEHNDSEIRATEGQDVVVRLPENPTAGYRWYTVSAGTTLGQPDRTFEGTNGGGPVGAGGTTVLTWATANKIGSHTISLKYSRGPSGAAAETFTLAIEVVAPEAESEYECPSASQRTINCMPPTNRKPFCKADYRTWAQANCDVSYLD